MTPAEQDKAFKKAVKLAAHERGAIQNDTVGEVVRLLNLAGAKIQKAIEGQPSDYMAWYLPQLKKEIEATLAVLADDAGTAAAAGQTKAWDAGKGLVDKPFAAAGVEIAATLPKLDTGQLLAMQSFLTGKMKDVSLDALNRVNGELALAVIGAQGIEDTLKGVQKVMGGISRRRATTIVRTELGRAFSTAGQLRQEQAAEVVPGLKKQWRRSGKIHSRRKHDLTDGQVRPVDKPFILGTGNVHDESAFSGVRLMYPHDPAAPPAETINCGCLSLPYMDSWKDAGLLAHPGKKAFSEQEIALNPFKAELNDPVFLKDITAKFEAKAAQDAQAAAVQASLHALAKEAGKIQLARSMAKVEAQAAAYKLQEALAGNLGKWYAQAAKAWTEGGKPLDTLAAEMKAAYETKLAITAYKKAALAGKMPSQKTLAKIFVLPLEQQAAIEAEIKATLAAPKAATALARTTTTTTTAADVDAVALVDVRDWRQVGPQAGSNPGGLFEDLEGARWYVKFPADIDRARNEVLAAKLYKLAGIEVPEVALVTREGRIGVGSRILEGLAKGEAALKAGTVEGVAEGFGVDAWLANWDVVGLSYDNLLIRNGRAVRVDTGGALLFRAQGTPKGAAFGSVVEELASLRNQAVNPQAGAVFGPLSDAHVKASVARVLALDDQRIRRTVLQYGPGDLRAREQLADLLLVRRQSMAGQFPDVAPQVAEIRRMAVETVQSSLQSALSALDADILTAVKGIASRAAKGAVLEEKDLARAASALAHYAEVRRQGEALHLSSLDALTQHYRPWLEALQQATAAGVGTTATWTSPGSFAGLSAVSLKVDAGKVAPVFAPFLFGAGGKYSAAEIKRILRGVETHFSRYEYLNTSTVPRNDTGADAFERMPPEYKRALWSWTPSHIYSAVNDAMLKAAEAGKKPAKAVREYADLLNEALREAPPEARHAGRSVRGVFDDDRAAEAFAVRMLNLMNSGDSYRFEGFASSSAATTPAFSGKRCYIHIDGKSGVKIASISSHYSENEVLFGTETQFVVTDVKAKGGRQHVYLKEI